MSTEDDQPATYGFSVVKGDSHVVSANATDKEDDFHNLYGVGKFAQGVQLIAPTYNFRTLENLTYSNNTLRCCIDAMTTNVYGTGWTIDTKKKAEDKKEAKRLREEVAKKVEELKEFFDEPYPGKSWEIIKKTVGDQLESTGMGYLELIRNSEGKMLYINNVDTKMIRMVRLDLPIEVPKKVKRGGKEYEFKMKIRYRRYAQLTGEHKTFFKEYGCPVDLDKRTGKWGSVEEIETPFGNYFRPLHLSANFAMEKKSAGNKQLNLNKAIEILTNNTTEDYNYNNSKSIDINNHQSHKTHQSPQSHQSPKTPKASLVKKRNKKRNAPKGGEHAALTPPPPRSQAPSGSPRDGSSQLYDTGSEMYDGYGGRRLVRGDVPAELQASELIVFGKRDDPDTSYSVPVWIPQIPSIRGSRQAEEMNLSFFDTGGVPPMMMFIQGGIMAAKAKSDLQTFMETGSHNKHNVPVIEIEGTGSLESASNTRVTVERFGSERQSDSMFETYDDKCSQRIRRAWRLPPIFTGNIEDYNFATAFASYTVAEAQVFKPEREEFDHIINSTLMKELDAADYLYRTNPLTVSDIQHKLEALNIAKESGALPVEQLFQGLNSIANIDIKPDEAKAHQDVGDDQDNGNPNGSPFGKAPEGPNPGADKPRPSGKRLPPAAEHSPSGQKRGKGKGRIPGEYDSQEKNLPVSRPRARKSNPTHTAIKLFSALKGGGSIDGDGVALIAKALSFEGDDRRVFNESLMSEMSVGEHSDDFAELVSSTFLGELG